MSKRSVVEDWIPLQSYFARASNYGVGDVAAAGALLARLKDLNGDFRARGVERIFESRQSNLSEAVTRQITAMQLERGDLAKGLETAADHVDSRYWFGGCAHCECDRCRQKAADPKFAPPMNVLSDAERKTASKRIHEIDAFIDSFYGDREVLPRRIDPVIIPAAYWADFETVSDDCTSDWSDDDEQPLNWGDIDWLSGHGRSFELWGSSWREYSAIQVQGGLVNPLIDELAKSDRWELARKKDAALRAFCASHSGLGGYEAAHKEWLDSPSGYGISRKAFSVVWKEERGERGRGAPRKNPPE